MTKAKNTKRALLSSALALLVCVSMLIGSTFAWFTDSASTGSNIIKSGNLDVVLQMKDEAGEWVSAEGQTLEWVTEDDVDNVLWEPGCTYKLPELRIRNAGNLALKYEVQITGFEGDRELLDVIDFTGIPVQDVTETLLPEAFVEFTIEGHMQESAGNTYMNKTLSGISITVVATQYTYENDSYTDQYDKDAKYPLITSDEKTENKELTLSKKIFKITIPAEANNGEYAMKVANDVMKTDADGKTTLSFDLSLTKDGVDVADGSATYTVNIDVDEGKIIESLTHNGQAVADFDYNQSTGIITFTTDSFSPFAVVYYDDLTYGKVAKLGDTYYETFAAAYNAANDGDTLTLIRDVKDFDVELKKAITLDLGGKTITDAYIKTSANITLQNGSIKNVNESYPIVINGGALTMENVAVEASKSDRAVWLRNSGTVLNFNSGSILATKGENNSNSKIYGVWVSKGATANINGGTIEVDAGATATAVAVFGNYVNTVNMTGGKLYTSGSTYSYGIWTEGKVTVSGGEIITNKNLYGYSSGITYGKNYVINTKGDVTISGGKITANGPSGYLVNAGGSNQNIVISDVEFECVLSEIDKTKGNHSAPVLIYGSSSSTEITGGNFKGVSASLTKGSASVSGGTFDVEINSSLLAEGCALTDNGNGTWTVTK